MRQARLMEVRPCRLISACARVLKDWYRERSVDVGRGQLAPARAGEEEEEYGDATVEKCR